MKRGRARLPLAGASQIAAVDDDLDAAGAQRLQAAAVDRRVGVGGADDHARHAAARASAQGRCGPSGCRARA